MSIDAGVAGFAQVVDLPVMVGGHAGSSDTVPVTRPSLPPPVGESMTSGLAESSSVLHELVSLRDALGRERIPQAGDAVGT